MDEFLELARQGAKETGVPMSGMTLECPSCKELVDNATYFSEAGKLEYTCKCGTKNEVEGLYLDV